MADQPESRLTVRFPLLGRETGNVVEWEIDSAYLVSTDGFSFKLLEEDRSLLRGLELQPVELIVEGATQLLGRIDASERGETALTGRYEGRDYIADLVESNVDPSVKFTANQTLGECLLLAAQACGIGKIVDDEDSAVLDVKLGTSRQTKRRSKNKRPSAQKVEEYKPRPGEGIYELLNRLVARYGVTIQPDADRTRLVLDRPDYTQEPVCTLFRTDDTTNASANNVIRGIARRDYSMFPTYELFTGTAGKSGKAGAPLKFEFDTLSIPYNSEVAEIIRAAVEGTRKRPTIDTTAPGYLYRLLYHRDEEARTEEQLQFAALRALGERTKDALVYTATVKGHADPRTGSLYTVNTMVMVDDAIADVHEPMWIARRTFRYGRDGASTELHCWRPELFKWTAEDE
jgi:prophage tail gpP-like protein